MPFAQLVTGLIVGGAALATAYTLGWRSCTARMKAAEVDVAGKPAWRIIFDPGLWPWSYADVRLINSSHVEQGAEAARLRMRNAAKRAAAET